LRDARAKGEALGDIDEDPIDGVDNDLLETALALIAALQG
jgi:hypothetical protein